MACSEMTFHDGEGYISVDLAELCHADFTPSLLLDLTATWDRAVLVVTQNNAFRAYSAAHALSNAVENDGHILLEADGKSRFVSWMSDPQNRYLSHTYQGLLWSSVIVRRRWKIFSGEKLERQEVEDVGSAGSSLMALQISSKETFVNESGTNSVTARRL